MPVVRRGPSRMTHPALACFAAAGFSVLDGGGLTLNEVVQNLPHDPASLTALVACAAALAVVIRAGRPRGPRAPRSPGPA